MEQHDTNQQPLRERTKKFALRVIQMYGALPKSAAARVIGNQVLRSGTSVAANCREAMRARSNAEFISRMCVVSPEMDETLLWFELLMESKLLTSARMQPLYNEADSLLGIIVASIRTAKQRNSPKSRAKS